mgnify:CR=1 FL=1
MKQGVYTLTHSRALTRDVRELRFEGDTGPLTAPGQFVNIRLDGCFLRRPISVCDWEKGSLVLIIKVVGRGTAALAGLRPGTKLDLLCGLGNGFTLAHCPARPLLLGGGLGAAPLYGLAKALLRQGAEPAAVLGFGSRADVFYEQEFRALGVPVHIATLDGSAGVPGTVLDALPPQPQYDLFYACGPQPMLKAACGALPGPGFVSLEERMGCGFGACMGCSCQTTAGSKRVCREGPVFAKEELVW